MREGEKGQEAVRVSLLISPLDWMIKQSSHPLQQSRFFLLTRKYKVHIFQIQKLSYNTLLNCLVSAKRVKGTTYFFQLCILEYEAVLCRWKRMLCDSVDTLWSHNSRLSRSFQNKIRPKKLIIVMIKQKKKKNKKKKLKMDKLDEILSR